MSDSRRVVVTGCGVICPLGNSVDELVEGLRDGRSGIAEFTRLPTGALPVDFGGEATAFTEKIDDFGPLDAAVKKQIRKGLKVMCREIKMGVAAAQHAIADSGIDLNATERDRVGVFFGADYIATLPDEFIDPIRTCSTGKQFDFAKWAEKGLPQVTPLWLLKYLPNMPACHVAIYNDLRGPSNSITMREASSNLAISEATSTMARNAADVVIAGATGCRIHPLRSLHTALQQPMATGIDNPVEACRPFDRDRRGEVLGEGAAVVMLESLEHATARGANILGEIVGYGASAVMSDRFEPNQQLAIANALQQSLSMAGIQPNDIGHIHAHGLGTKVCDACEAQAIASVFGAARVPLVAAKSNFGNLGASSGLVEFIASLRFMQEGHLFPARNYQTPDPDCPVTLARHDDEPAGPSVMNVSVTPQGQASTVVALRSVR